MKLTNAEHMPVGRNGGIRGRRSFAAIFFLSLVCVVGYLQLKSFELSRSHYLTPDYSERKEGAVDWQSINPSSKLKWQNCLPNRQCARLEVPLDYDHPLGEKAAIALIRIKAKVSPGSKKYRGPVLFNPGGPGGSGVYFVHMVGQEFQKIIGDEYDIVGFDPRGVGMTTPQVSVFPDAYERAYWDSGAPPLPNVTFDSFPRAYVRSQLVGELAMERTMHAARHVSTATVARDMLSITKAHGRDHLLYWGFSYGSVLGATYAALFPDNIDRLVIDGVVDFEDYYAGRWASNLHDTDNILQFFYNECAAAGSACPLNANSSRLVQQRVENTFAAIKANPIRVFDRARSDYGIIDYSLLKHGLFSALYQPFTALVRYASILAALENGDGIPALRLLRQLVTQPKCDSPPSAPPAVKDASRAISCGEGIGAGRDMVEIVSHFSRLSDVSVFADVWTEIRLECAGWKINANNRYGGPFNSTTRFPLLVIGNTADPVTPLVGAKKAAAGFKGARLLTVNTPGHCSPAGTSFSAISYIRRYFREGILPPEGAVCEIENKMFGGKQAENQALTMEDRELLEVARGLSHKFGSIRDGYLL